MKIVGWVKVCRKRLLFLIAALFAGLLRILQASRQVEGCYGLCERNVLQVHRLLFDCNLERHHWCFTLFNVQQLFPGLR